MGQGNEKKPFDVQAAIKEAVNAGLQAGRMAAGRAPGDAYKATEKRLYAYPVLLERIADNKERLEEYATHGAPGHSKSIVRFSRSGVRLTPDEILEALIQDMTATIAADEHEAEIVAGALETIAGDLYYAAVYGKFIQGQTDDDIAASIPCDPSTVRRNRGRLVRTLAVWAAVETHHFADDLYKKWAESYRGGLNDERL